jgi:D-sedoheptulose 7-phosphate isomerase
MKFSIQNYLNCHKNLFEHIDVEMFEAGIDLIQKKFTEQGTIFTCGNGGSALTASHYVTDWNKMISMSSGGKFRGISLCDNLGLVTAFANDISYDEIFSGQLKSLMDKDDLLVAISGSGNSSNVIKAVEYANSIGAQTLAIVGYDGGNLKKVAKNSVWVNSFDMQLCEDIHLMFGHMVMKKLCNLDIQI